jgi:uncharacterized protein YdeI (YjbR/CyaY-like superfamily)
MSEPTYFKTQAAWRKWLEKNHTKKAELVVGFHKVGSGNQSITYKEALDEALSFGWIDGVRRGGEQTYTIRFTPRRRKSIWSAVNIKRIEELKAEGKVHAAGLAAYEARDPKQQKKYSFENRDAALSAGEERTFRSNRKAWSNFSAMPPSYRHPATWWVVSAKKPETRTRRLATLIADSEAGRRIKLLTPAKKA